MNDTKLMAAATKLAEQTPQHLDQPTTPPLAWQQVDDQLVVILADGRKVRGLLANYLDQPGRKPEPVETPPAPSIAHAAKAAPRPPRPASKPRARGVVPVPARG